MVGGEIPSQPGAATRSEKHPAVYPLRGHRGLSKTQEGRGDLTLTVARTGVAPERTEFDPGNPDELVELEKQFSTLKDEGMMAVATRGGVRTQVHNLDTEAEDITFHSPLVGG
jgi:hypothetical protein